MLYDQFDSLNVGSDPKNPNIRSKKFKHSQDPEHKMIVLVYFSDEILNKAAEE